MKELSVSSLMRYLSSDRTCTELQLRRWASINADRTVSNFDATVLDIFCLAGSRFQLLRLGDDRRTESVRSSSGGQLMCHLPCGICLQWLLRRQVSVVHIEHSETTDRGKLTPGGLSDPKLGTIDRKSK